MFRHPALQPEAAFDDAHVASNATVTSCLASAEPQRGSLGGRRRDLPQLEPLDQPGQQRDPEPGAVPGVAERDVAQEPRGHLLHSSAVPAAELGGLE